MARYFTREEAEALLPEITVVLHKIQTTRREARSNQQELELLRARLMSNGHNHNQIIELQKDLETQIEILRTLLEKLDEFGCELKDPDTGLIDFLNLRDGEEVYLCWLLGEDRIRFWHSLDTGFAGRQPL